MEYFVTLTLLRSTAPRLFVSGDRIDGQQRFEEQLQFEGEAQLSERLLAADLPIELLEQDLPSPLLVKAEQMEALGLSLPSRDPIVDRDLT